MLDSTKRYVLRTENVEGIDRYYVSFKDAQGGLQETEVSHPVYLEFCCFEKQERNMRRSDERHIEQSELAEETLYKRALRPPKSTEEMVSDKLRNEWLYGIVAQLPETQRRRLLLYYVDGMTYEEIAGIENCTFQAVAKSVKTAENFIKNIF